MSKLTHAAVAFEHPAKGPHHCGECAHRTATGCQIVEDPIEDGDWCEKFRQLRKRHGGPVGEEVYQRFMPADATVQGRTICAYAAVFNRQAEIRDRDGHYIEVIDPGAFAEGLAQRNDRIFAVYNHGRNLDYSPSAEHSVPYGIPTVSREDHKGWYTETLVNEGPEGDRLLSAARNVDPVTGQRALRGQSFTGFFLRSSPPKPPGGYQPDARGNLTVVHRQKIMPIEYGLTPIPAYKEAEVVGVRSQRADVTMSGPAAYVKEAGDTIQCPQCLLMNDEQAEFCDQCGAGLPGYGSKSYAPRAGDDMQCPNCGAGNQPDARYCDQCGKPFPHSSYEAMLAAQGAKAAQPAAAAGGDTKAAASTPSGATSSSGRQPAGTERAMASVTGPDGAEDTPVSDTPQGQQYHGRAIGRHIHRHGSMGGPDADGDGQHLHEHAHWDDADHDHAHRTGYDGRSAWPVSIVASRFDLDVAEVEAMEPREVVQLARGLDGWDLAERASKTGDTAGGPPKPYGDVEYADPKHGKYPIDAAHVVAAWSYINKPKNAAKYPWDGVTLAEVKGRIRAAMKKHGHEVSDDDSSKSSTSSSGRRPELSGAATRSAAGPQSARSASSDRAQEGAGVVSDNPNMTMDERAARQAEISRRQDELNAEFSGGALPADRQAEWNELVAEDAMHQEAIAAQTSRTQYLMAKAQRQGGGVPGYDTDSGYGRQASADNGHPEVPVQSRSAYAGFQGTIPSSRQLDRDVWDMTTVRTYARSIDDMPQIYRDRAQRVLEFARFPAERSGKAVWQERQTREDIQAGIEHLMHRSDDPQAFVAQRMLSTGSPVYQRAFGKIMAHGLEMLNSEEMAAVQRALTIGTPASFGPGSFPVPYQVDPTVTLTSNGVINALRQIARVEQIVGREWLGVTSNSVVVTRAPENQVTTDASPTLAQPGVAATRVQAFIPFSMEVEQDWNGLLAEISVLLADGKDIEEAGSFLTGNGTSPNPQGVITGLGTSAPEQILTATTAVTSISDIYNVETQMAPRFRAQSSFLASKGGYNAMRQLWTQVASAAGDPWVRPSAGTPAEFIGYPAYENSNMATSGTTSGNVLLVDGDFKQFLIVDRIGMSIELVPHVFQQQTAGTGFGFPMGQRGVFALWRNNSIVLAPNAFRFLQVR